MPHLSSNPDVKSLTIAGSSTVAEAIAIRDQRAAAARESPMTNGMDLIGEIRKLPNHKGTPIIVLTTESDASLKQEGKAAGATGWLTKPFNQDQLLSIAKKFVG